MALDTEPQFFLKSWNSGLAASTLASSHSDTLLFHASTCILYTPPRISAQRPTWKQPSEDRAFSEEARPWATQR